MGKQNNQRQTLKSQIMYAAIIYIKQMMVGKQYVKRWNIHMKKSVSHKGEGEIYCSMWLSK